MRLAQALVCKNGIHRIDHAARAAHRHGKFQRFAAAARREGIYVFAIRAEACARRVNRLLLIADKTEATRLRPACSLVSRPLAHRRAARSRDLGEHGKHFSIGVLRLIENDDETARAQPVEDLRVGDQLPRPRDLIGISHTAFVAAKIAKADRDLRGDARGGVAEPARQFAKLARERFLESRAAGSEFRKREKVGLGIKLREPVAQRALIFRRIFLRARAGSGERLRKSHARRIGGDVIGEDFFGVGWIDFLREREEIFKSQKPEHCAHQVRRQRDRIERGAFAKACPKLRLIGILEQINILRQAEEASLLAHKF